MNLESHQVPVVLSFLNFHLKRESPLLNIFWNIFSNEKDHIAEFYLSVIRILYNLNYANNHSLFLINLADKANISFIIIQESSICNAFSEFFQLLADSEYITPENQTRTLIQKYIRQLKQLTFDITP